MKNQGENNVQEVLDFINRIDSSPTINKENIISLDKKQNLIGMWTSEEHKLIGLITLAHYHTLHGRAGRIEDVFIDSAIPKDTVWPKILAHLSHRAKQLRLDYLEFTSPPEVEDPFDPLLYQKLGFQQRETNVYRYSLTPPEKTEYNSMFLLMDRNDLTAVNALAKTLNPAFRRITDKHIMLLQTNGLIDVIRDVLDNQIIGFGTLIFYNTLKGYKSRIEDVIVDEAHRGQGLGEYLARRLIRAGSKLGLQTIELTSSPQRKAANALYQKLGFQLVTEAKVYKKMLT